MQINRLLEITMLLLSRGTLTARELAERFEVSTRTIYRDIEVLSAAGVPVYANRGAGGGIALLENYSLSKTILSDKESESILFALQTLQATRYPEIEKTLDKLGALFSNAAADWVQIDFSPWGSNPNAFNKLNSIKQAILVRKVLLFDYIDSENKRGSRKLEPLRLVFKGQAWYLWGWDLQREDYRLFRISRIHSVCISNTSFDRNRSRTPKHSELIAVENSKVLVRLTLRFSKEAAHRLYDDYDDGFIQKNTDGTYTVEVEFPEDEWVYGYILSFGPFVEVLSPEHIRRIIKEKTEKMLVFY